MSRAFCVAIAFACLVACENHPTDPACDNEYYLLMFDGEGNGKSSWTLGVGDSVKLAGVAQSGSLGWSGDGCQLYLFSSSTRPAEFSWTSSNTAAVTVTSGLVRAIAPGMSHVRAIHGDQFVDVIVTVSTPSSPAR
jgi:hypothetical protein